MVLARSSRGIALKFALAIGGAGLLWVLASFVVTGGDARSALFVACLAALPALAYVAWRWPVAFPFGLFILLVPFDPLLGTSGGAGATLTKFVGFASALALAFRIVRSRRILIAPKAWYVWSAVVLLMSASAMWSIDVELTISTLLIVLQLYLLYTIVAIYPLTGGEFRAVKAALIGGGTIVSLYGFYAYATGQRLGAARLSLSNGKLHFDPNHYAAFFMLPLGFIAVGFMTAKSALHKAAYGLLFLTLCANVFLSGSRGGLIGVAFLVAYAGFRTRKVAATALIGAAGLALSFAIPNVWARFADPTQGGGSGRNDIWTTGLHAARGYWAFGSGFATYPDAYNQSLLSSVQHNFAGWSRPAHNLLIQSAVELGLAGLALVLYAWWTTLRQNRSVPRDHPLFGACVAAESSVVGLFWMALTIDLLWFKYLWLGMMVPVMLANLARPRTLRARVTGALRRARSPVRPQADRGISRAPF